MLLTPDCLKMVDMGAGITSQRLSQIGLQYDLTLLQGLSLGPG